MSTSDAVTDLSALEDGKTYVFYAVNLQKYIQMGHSQEDLGNGHLANAGSLSADDENSGLSVFTFHKEDGENTYSFESACSGYYIQTVVDGASYLNTTKAQFVIQANPDVTGQFRIKNVSNNLSFNMQPSQFCGWKSEGANQWYQIIPATVSDETVSYVKATSNFKLGEATLKSIDEWLKPGTVVTDYQSAFDKCSFYTIAGVSDRTLSESNREFNYEVTESNVPVEFGKWYRLQTRYSQDAFKNQAFIKVANEDNAEVLKCNATFTESSFADYDDFSNSLWCIERSGLGVKLRNKGTGKYMKANGTGFAATMDASGTEFYMNEGVSAGSNFTLYANSAYFGSHQSLNGQSTPNNARMRLWAGDGNLDNAKNDPGSNFTFVDVDASSDVLAIGKSALKKQFTVTASAASSDYLTFDVSEFQSKANEVDAKTNLTELDAFRNSVSVYGAPEADAYYRIKSVGSADGKAYLTTEGMFVGKDGRLNTSYNNGAAYDGENLNRNITRSASDAAFVPQVWKLISTGNNTYKVLNANTQRYIAFFNGTTLDMPIAEDYSAGINLKASTAKFDGSDNTMWQIVWNNFTLGTTGETGFGKKDAVASDKSIIWQLEKVTSVPVSISDVNYASIALPFAVKVDESEGVEAYYVKEINDGEMLLTAFDNGIIPANTGAILYHNGATTAHLSLVSTGNSVEGNKLQPVTARRLGYTARTTYVLAKNSSDEAAFLLNSLTKIPANKAYVDASSVSNTATPSMLSFKLGETTGLDDAAISNPANRETYYDLNGRVVLYPHNGIFVNSKGQKVFIR